MIYLCNFIHAHVNEQEVVFQIGTVIPMVLTNTLYSTNLFLIFVITLFPAVT